MFSKKTGSSASRSGDIKLRFTNGQRRRLALKAKLLGRAELRKIATLAEPDTILGCYRSLIAKKYHGSKKRAPGRPRTRENIVALVLKMARRIRCGDIQEFEGLFATSVSTWVERQSPESSRRMASIPLQ